MTSTADIDLGVATRRRLVETAYRLFYAHGVRSVGIDRIIAEAGVSKATLYRHFPGKDDLVVEFVRVRDELWRTSMDQRVHELAPDPADRPLALFDAVAERCASGDFRGCAFTNTIVDLGDATHPAHIAAAAHKDSAAAWIAQLLTDAGYAEPAPLARQLLLLLDGAVVTALREGRPDAAYVAREVAAVLLGVSAD